MTSPRLRWAIRRPGLILPVFFFVHTLTTNGQALLSDARSRAIGGAISVYGFSPLQGENPANPVRQTHLLVAAGHAIPFFVSETGISSLECILPVNPGAFHCKWSTQGLPGFRNFSWRSGYSMNLSDRLTAGIAFNYLNTLIPNEWNYLWTIGLSAGIIYELSESTRLGGCIINPVSFGNYSSYGPLFPSTVAAGIAHIFYEKSILLTEVSSDTDGGLQFKSGIEYAPLPSLIFRIGYRTKYSTLSFGTGIRKERVTVDISFEWSSLAGVTPAILLTYTPER